MRSSILALIGVLAAPAHANEASDAIDKQIQAIAGEPDVMAGIWCGGRSAEPVYQLQATRSMPAASVIKTAILVELFASHATTLDGPIGAAMDAVLADDHHPAMTPLSAKERVEVRAAFDGASPRTVGAIMMGSKKASSAVYNAAANLAIAVLGGPASATAKIHARDPAFAGIMVRRYMLASRTKDGDNEATPASLASVLRAIAIGQVPGVDGATTDAIVQAMAKTVDPTLGAHYSKVGNLDTDPMTMVKTGFFLGAKGRGPVIYVVALAMPAAPSGSRAEAHRRLEKMADSVMAVLLGAARSR